MAAKGLVLPESTSVPNIDDLHAEAQAIRDLLRVGAGTALPRAQRLIAVHPENAVALRTYARAARASGFGEEAARAELHAIRLGLAHPDVLAAERALAAGRLEDAEQTIRPYLRANPEDVGAALILGTVAERCGAAREAENLFRRSVALAPAHADAHLALVRLLIAGARTDDALDALDALLTLDDTHAVALGMRARVLWQARRLDDAERAYRHLVAVHPRDGAGWLNLGHLLKTVGRMEECVGAYRQAVAVQPSLGIAWWGLANLKSVKLDRADADAMEGALQTAQADDDRIHLHFALGKALGDLGDYAASMSHYDRGSAIRRRGAPHSAEKIHAGVRQAAHVFDQAFYDNRRGWGASARDPIFIVSLPRSGSTLVEQILASHSMVEGTEELHDLERVAQAVGRGARAAAYLEHVASLTEEQVRAAGEHYLDATRRFRHTDRPLFTDKMPSNWMLVGLINLILPNARIVDVRRHPMSCGFANYSQHFNRGIDFSYDLGDIGRFYADYVDQMAHFDRVLPGRIHRIVYEDLVADPEAQVRALLAYLELPFEETCLRFYENDRAVHTPSAEQVRRPINRDGMERWRHYAPWLGPLENALGPVLDSYPDAPRR